MFLFLPENLRRPDFWQDDGSPNKLTTLLQADLGSSWIKVEYLKERSKNDLQSSDTTGHFDGYNF